MNKNVKKRAASELKAHRARKTALECMALRGEKTEGTAVKAAVDAVELALGGLHPDDRYLLTEFYVDRADGSFDRLRSCFDCSESSVYRKKRLALERFAMRLFGSVE